MSNKSCGGCQSFTKMLHLIGNGGLCEWFDARTNVDFGHECSGFKALKYDRNKEKQAIKKELEIDDD